MFLLARGPPANKFLFAGGPPAYNFLFAGGPPANKFLFAGRPPANNLFHYFIMLGWLGVSRVGRSQDREINLIKLTTRTRPSNRVCNFFVRDETKTKLYHLLMYETNPRQDMTQNIGRDRDEVSLFYKTETRTIF